MSYPPVPTEATLESGSAATEEKVRALLRDLAARKEFHVGDSYAGESGRPIAANPILVMTGLQLVGAQMFVRNLAMPATGYSRLLLEWQTGTGKSIAAIGIAQEYVREFRARTVVAGHVPRVFVISFTARETIQEDMLRYPEFGFATAAESAELRRLRAAASADAAGTSSESRAYQTLSSALRRRLTDPARSGYYQFYGYKEFANRLFRPTAKGIAAGFDVLSLYTSARRHAAAAAEAGTEPEDFGVKLADAWQKGHVNINDDLLDQMRGGFLICDEIHNVYNMHKTNNYGVAIQYMLDALDDDAPHAIFLSATPMTGAASEVVDLLNLLVRRRDLPGLAPLARSQFFAADGQLRAGALERIRHLAAGRVSFLLDTDVQEYPRRVFVGTPAEGVPYLRFTVCPLTPLQARTIDAAADDRGGPQNLDNRKVATGGDDSGDDSGDDRGNNSDDDSSGDSSGDSGDDSSDDSSDDSGDDSGGDSGDDSSDDSGDDSSDDSGDDSGDDSNILRVIGGDGDDEDDEGDDGGGGAGQKPSCVVDVLNEDGATQQVTLRRCRGFSQTMYTLYDMVFPNPDPAAKVGLYSSETTPRLLAGASAAWREKTGIRVERGADYGLVGRATAIITGDFLAMPTLARYSGKYARLVEEVHKVLRAGPGKVMVYHHRVRMSGVLLLQEVLRMNGFVDEESDPTDATLCGVCGVAQKAHKAKAAHTYTPARFAVAHSDIRRTVMLRSLAKYNAPANADGAQIRVLIGSKVIREGLNFKAVRHQFICALPTDFPSLIQVFGRVVRKDSHAGLPAEERDVSIHILACPTEMARYAAKGREYLVIQEVDRALRQYAVDGFANWGRIAPVVEAAGAAGSLDTLPYEPAVPPEPGRGAMRTTTFHAFGHGEAEVAAIFEVCRVLFRAAPVWTVADLWAAVRAGGPPAGKIRRLYYNAHLFTEGGFGLALRALRDGFVETIGGDQFNLRGGGLSFANQGLPLRRQPVCVVRIPRVARPKTEADKDASDFLILARLVPGPALGGVRGLVPDVDTESFLRLAVAPTAGAPVRVRVGDFLRAGRAGAIFEHSLADFEATYLAAEDGRRAPLEHALVDLPEEFHYALLRALATSEGDVTSDDVAVVDLYRRYRIAFTASEVPERLGARRSGRRGAVVAYATRDAVAVLGGDGEWHNAALSDFGAGRRHEENGIVVGFTAPPGCAAEACAQAAVKFKVRPPIQVQRRGHSGDLRTIDRGAVCETRTREELAGYVARLRRALARDEDEPAESADSSRVRASQPALCQTMRSLLLRLEELSRQAPDGMKNGVRYVYLYCDRPPTITRVK